MNSSPLPKRSVFFLSDRTGITAESLGRGLMTQFEGAEFDCTRLPFVDTLDKAREAVARINAIAAQDGTRPIVFSTMVNAEVLELVRRTCNALVLDLFDAFNAPLEAELGIKAAHVMGRSHGIGDFAAYTARIEALHYALANDDGVSTRHYDSADIVLIGVSRSGKTPTCLFMALQFGVFAANYPITEENMLAHQLPEPLQPYRDKLFGLTIDPERLQQIRHERRPNSRYATAGQCRMEVAAVETLYRHERIRHIDTTTMSIEEIATTILEQAGLRRRLFA